MIVAFLRFDSYGGDTRVTIPSRDVKGVVSSVDTTLLIDQDFKIELSVNAFLSRPINIGVPLLAFCVSYVFSI